MLHIAICDDDGAAVQANRSIAEDCLKQCGYAGEIAAYTHSDNLLYDIDAFELCVLFANALDNAIAACRGSVGAKAIRISGRQQGDFYMLTFENTCSDEPMPPAGTGLSNIRAVAEKSSLLLQWGCSAATEPEYWPAY